MFAKIVTICFYIGFAVWALLGFHVALFVAGIAAAILAIIAIVK